MRFSEVISCSLHIQWSLLLKAWYLCVVVLEALGVSIVNDEVAGCQCMGHVSLPTGAARVISPLRCCSMRASYFGKKIHIFLRDCYVTQCANSSHYLKSNGK